MTIHRSFPAIPAFGLLAGALAAQVIDVDLPEPYATESVRNASRVVERPEGAELKVPDGFHVEEYASGFRQPRFMTLGPSNELVISDSGRQRGDGVVYVLRDTDGDHRIDESKAIIENLDRPYGLAFWHDYLYVGETTSLKRYRYDADAMTAGPGEEVVSMADFGGGHWTRTVVFDPQGEKMYLSIGSGSNVDTGEPEMRAAINRFNPDGTGHEIYASGTRNPVGLRFYPGTNTLFVTVHERDALGDDLVPDYFTHLQEGGFYGWPYYYIGQHEDPRHAGERPDLKEKVIVPDLPYQAHSGNMDFWFYTGSMFPEKYRGGAFVAFHGSWNRSRRTGYKLVYVPFEDGRISGPPEDFLTGFMLSPDRPEVWGRPVGLLGLPDGSLLMSEDGGNKIWRITYGD